MAPVIFKKVNLIKKPVDFGVKYIDGKPLFGKNKTFQGIIFATLFGIMVAYIQFWLSRYETYHQLLFMDYSNWMLIGFLLGFGAIMGDLIKSFFKRRFNIEPGKPFFPYDQLDFVIGALLSISFYYFPGLNAIMVLIILSPFLHIVVNHAAFYLKIRGEKW